MGWLENIQLNASSTDDLILVLAGNKCDLAGRPTDDEMVQHLCSIHNMTYYETSAKTRQNIDKMFYEVAELVLKKRGLEPTLKDTITLDKPPVVPQEEKEKKKSRCRCL